MTWKKINSYTLTDGTHNIAKAMTPNVPLPYALYQLEPKRLIGHYATSEEAKAASLAIAGLRVA